MLTWITFICWGLERESKSASRHASKYRVSQEREFKRFLHKGTVDRSQLSYRACCVTDILSIVDVTCNPAMTLSKDWPKVRFCIDFAKRVTGEKGHKKTQTYCAKC